MNLRCGFRGVRTIMKTLKDILAWDFECVPSRNSIENWVLKSGYSIYKEPLDDITEEDYAVITDESMMIGRQKLLLMLGVKADKKGDCALGHQDVSVLKMSVKSSWDAQNITAELKDTAKTVGHPPRYVISDNASSMVKGIQQSGYTHIRDISHTLGMFLERQYKDSDDFKNYMGEVSSVKFREIMKQTAYLLPPKQRTIARFMNLSNVAKWGVKMLEIYHRLSAREKEVFSFIPAHASFIYELSEVLDCVNCIQKEIKTYGLAAKTVRSSIEHVRRNLYGGNARMRQLADLIVGYLTTEIGKVTKKADTWHACSDIIESIFGVYKAKKALNPLYGVTLFSLFIPLYTRIGNQAKQADQKKLISVDFKTSLEQFFLSDIQRWRDTHLPDNQVEKRRRLLKSA